MATEKSDQKPTVFEALLKVREDVGAVRKGDRNEDQRYLFRGIDAVVNAVSPVMIRHGVNVFPIIQEVAYEARVTKNGTHMTSARLQCAFVFVGPAGDTFTCATAGEGFDVADKATSKAMSVCLRTALLQALMLPTDDVDPDAHTPEESSVASSGAVSGTVVADPEREALLAAQKRVQDYWESRGWTWDIGVVGQHYQTLMGADVMVATPAQLDEYVEKLKLIKDDNGSDTGNGGEAGEQS